MPVVSNMTWSVQFRGMGENDYAGVDIYTPATTGQNYPEYWENLGNDLFPYWVLLTNSAAGPMDFAAQMEASDQPAPVNLERPALTAVKIGPNMLVSWPCDRVGWTLEAQTNAPGAGIVANGTSWHTITNSQFANSWFFPLTKGSVFCRLRSPLIAP